MTDSHEILQRRLERERAARLEAERLLEEKSDELYETLMKVQSSEALLHSALTSMTDGLLLTNRHHEVILCNQQMQIIYPEQADLFHRSSDLEKRFTSLLEHPVYLDSVQKSDPSALFEIDLPDGRVISVGMRLTREGLISTTHRDISEIKQSEEERRVLLVDLLAAQRMETIGRMSGMIAHDFNNIIASIKGYADFLADDLPDNAQLRDSVDRIIASAERAEKLIQQILAYGDERQAPTHKVSLVPLLEDCLDMALPDKPEHIHIQFDPPETPIWVMADEDRLGRLFMNLMSNARRAMADEGGRLTLLLDVLDTLELEHDGKQHPDFPTGRTCSNMIGPERFGEPVVRVTLIDSGHGIEPHVMERIFEMYFSTREEGQPGGVGMSSVADIAVDFGGCVQVTSASDVGTAVEVVIPTVSSVVNRPVRTPASSDPESTEACDVMVIDDEPDVGVMLRMMLERAGISAVYMSSPRKALNLLLQHPDQWKVVICDQIMPELKGSEIYERLRDAGNDVPFIICSAQIDPSDLDIRDELGENFVSKPVGRRELLEKVSRHL